MQLTVLTAFALLGVALSFDAYEVQVLSPCAAGPILKSQVNKPLRPQAHLRSGRRQNKNCSHRIFGRWDCFSGIDDIGPQAWHGTLGCSWTCHNFCTGINDSGAGTRALGHVYWRKAAHDNSTRIRLRQTRNNRSIKCIDSQGVRGIVPGGQTVIYEVTLLNITKPDLTYACCCCLLMTQAPGGLGCQWRD